MKRFEFLDHTADLLVKAYGDTLAEAYASAADALFDVITAHAPVLPGKRMMVEVEGLDPESLLVSFLSELLVRHEVDRIVMGDFHVDELTDTHLSAIADFEPFSEDRHGGGLHVKAIAYHMIEIEMDVSSDRASVQVLLDI